MNRAQTEERLRAKGIQPSAQRVALAHYLFNCEHHPSADEVWDEAKRDLPQVSRATVYNTLSLLVEKGLLRQVCLKEGRVAYDSNLERHHHFVDEDSGRIFDIPWERIDVTELDLPDGFEASDYQVVIRGRKIS